MSGALAVFAVGAAAGVTSRWHAVQVAAATPARSGPDLPGGDGERAQKYSVCGLRCDITAWLGLFAYDNPWLEQGRCERCAWVVAISRGTIDEEIGIYSPAPGERQLLVDAGVNPDLLANVLVAILADALPGPGGQAGHRSDLLAHAASHRPVFAVCGECSSTGSAAVVHGPRAANCPDASVICPACSFTAGSWAGSWQGAATGDCDVVAPCSVLVTLSAVYGIDTRPAALVRT